MLQPDSTMTWDPGVAYISNFQSINGIAASASTHDDDNNEIMDSGTMFDGPQTDLNSHANMPVLGQNSYVIKRLGRTVDVRPFTSDYKAMMAELVHSAIWYECLYEGKTYILVIRNAIYILTMMNNLTPIFSEGSILKFFSNHNPRNFHQNSL